MLQRVCDSLRESIRLQEHLQQIIDDDIFSAVSDTMDGLVMCLIQTYCRMRGKDLCCQIMATEFTNLVKDIQPMMAVVSYKVSYKTENKWLHQKLLCHN